MVNTTTVPDVPATKQQEIPNTSSGNDAKTEVKKKKPRRTMVHWRVEPYRSQMVQAICLVRQSGMSTKSVAERFKIPPRTLRRYVSDPSRLGLDIVFPAFEKRRRRRKSTSKKASTPRSKSPETLDLSKTPRGPDNKRAVSSTTNGVGNIEWEVEDKEDTTTKITMGPDGKVKLNHSRRWTVEPYRSQMLRAISMIQRQGISTTQVANMCGTKSLEKSTLEYKLDHDVNSNTNARIQVLALCVFTSFTLADMFGIALCALGMLSTLSVGLSIDAYGPITDNAGGMAEMSGMDEAVRTKTDVLDAAGNTTAAIGKGFAIGSAALVSLALFGAFVTRSKITGVDILQPITFAGLLVGAMLPYWFTAMTVKSVGIAAKAMVLCVKRTLDKEKLHIFKTDAKGNVMYDPDTDTALFLDESDPMFIPPEELNNGNFYREPIRIATDTSLSEMIAPGALVMLAPIITGYFFGVHAVTGLLAGGMTSGVQMAISQSNTGGAWDNAKKWVEKDQLTKFMAQTDSSASKKKYGKGSDCHAAAVVGDTVGDPLKDTSGPALNILMKLMAIVSLVFAPFFSSHSVCSSIGTC